MWSGTEQNVHAVATVSKEASADRERMHDLAALRP